MTDAMGVSKRIEGRLNVRDVANDPAKSHNLDTKSAEKSCEGSEEIENTALKVTYQHTSEKQSACGLEEGMQFSPILIDGC